MNIEHEITAIKERLNKLEALVLPSPAKKQKREQVAAHDFGGATGGVRLLLSKGFFQQRRQFAEIMQALNSEGYLYSKQAFHDALTRLSKIGGPLASIKQGANKVYAERK